MSFATEVSALLQDSSNVIFSATGEIATAINDALRMFSRKKPREQNDVLYTMKDVRDVDISMLTESTLIFGYDSQSFHPIYGVEYPTGKWPREYRNFNVEPDPTMPYIVMDLDDAPTSSGEEVAVRYFEVWTETNLPSGYDDIIIRLATALVLIGKPTYYQNDFQSTSTLLNTMTESLDEASNRIQQSIDDLDTGRDLIGDERDEAVTAIDLAQAAITAIGTAITAAEAYYNTVNIGTPEKDYITGSAAHRASIANEQLALARGHLSFESTSQSWRSQATTELQAANTALSELRGSAEHLKIWMAKVNLAKEYEARGQRLMSEVMPELNKYTMRRPYKRWSTG